MPQLCKGLCFHLWVLQFAIAASIFAGQKKKTLTTQNYKTEAALAALTQDEGERGKWYPCVLQVMTGKWLPCKRFVHIQNKAQYHFDLSIIKHLSVSCSTQSPLPWRPNICRRNKNSLEQHEKFRNCIVQFGGTSGLLVECKASEDLTEFLHSTDTPSSILSHLYTHILYNGLYYSYIT